jgi:hypothetical protein
MKKIGVLTPSFVDWLDREVEKRYGAAAAKSEAGK